MPNLLLFSGRSNPELAQKIGKALELPLGKLEIRNFKDGEIWAKFGDNLRGADVVIVQGTQPPADNLLELLILIDAARRASARSITVVTSYFGYARQDRKDQPRVSITAKLVTNLITIAGADRVICLDLHANQIQGFFDIPVDHVFASSVLLPYWRAQNIPKLTVASPDVNGGKMARSWAKRLGVKTILVDQERTGHNASQLLDVIGDKKNIRNHNILLVDDIIDTGGKFCRAAVTLKKLGAKNIYGCCVHAVLSGNAYQAVEKAPIKKLVVSDSLPLKRKTAKIEVVSVAPLLAEVIQRAATNLSISSLFDQEEMKR